MLLKSPVHISSVGLGKRRQVRLASRSLASVARCRNVGSRLPFRMHFKDAQQDRNKRTAHPPGFPNIKPLLTGALWSVSNCLRPHGPLAIYKQVYFNKLPPIFDSRVWSPIKWRAAEHNCYRNLLRQKLVLLRDINVVKTWGLRSKRLVEQDERYIHCKTALKWLPGTMAGRLIAGLHCDRCQRDLTSARHTGSRIMTLALKPESLIYQMSQPKPPLVSEGSVAYIYQLLRSRTSAEYRVYIEPSRYFFYT